MNPEQEQGERLRAALARSVDAYAPSPAPVARVLGAGRVRRARRRAAVVAAAAAVVVVAVTVPLSRLAGERPTTTAQPRPATAVPAPPAHASTPPAPLTVPVGSGTVRGLSWSVRLEFYPTAPAGYAEPRTAGAPTRPAAAALLCQRMFVGGVRIDHQGGAWSDCQGLSGPHDPSGSGSAGLWGLHDKGTAGFRLFVSNPAAGVAYGVVRLAGGGALTGTVAVVPGTGYRAWAVAIPSGRTITEIDEFDARDHRVSRDTNFA